MTHTQRIFAIVTSAATLVFILELVRRRKLKEEYSWLWILTAAIMLVLSSWYGLIEELSRLVGAVTPTTTLFLFGLLFLLLISVHFSTVISRLTQQVRRLAQEVAILTAERDRAPDAEGVGPRKRPRGAVPADADP
jgi:hypothetical protein